MEVALLLIGRAEISLTNRFNHPSVTESPLRLWARKITVFVLRWDEATGDIMQVVHDLSIRSQVRYYLPPCLPGEGVVTI
jgi:hypothetical protein